MSVQLRSRVHAVPANLCETGGRRNLPLDSWLSRGALAAALVAAVSFIDIPTASAVPSFARQTGQPCATCHTAFPELTPYGRQFKLMGYTAGGNRCNDGSAKSDETQVPLALMSLPATFTRRQELGQPGQTWGRRPTSATTLGTPASRVCSSPGSSIAMSVPSLRRPTTPSGNAFTWDNVDIRYAKTGVISGTSVVYGITANNNPTVQDVVEYCPRLGRPLHGHGRRPRAVLRHDAGNKLPTVSKSAVSAATSGSTAASMRNFRRLWQPAAADPHEFGRRIRFRQFEAGRIGALLAAGLRKEPGTRTR